MNRKQKEYMRDFSYNAQFNELFKLHKYLVNHPLLSHTIDDNPVDDSIELINSLTATVSNYLPKLKVE